MLYALSGCCSTWKQQAGLWRFGQSIRATCDCRPVHSAGCCPTRRGPDIPIRTASSVARLTDCQTCALWHACFPRQACACCSTQTLCRSLHLRWNSCFQMSCPRSPVSVDCRAFAGHSWCPPCSSFTSTCCPQSLVLPSRLRIVGATCWWHTRLNALALLCDSAAYICLAAAALHSRGRPRS